jgi:hypothetical protein
LYLVVWHRITVLAQRIAAGSSRREIRPLDHKAAVEDGADVLGEVFVFSLAASYVVYEYTTSSRKSTEETTRRTQTITSITNGLESLEASVVNLHQAQRRQQERISQVTAANRELLDQIQSSSLQPLLGEGSSR